MRLIKTYKVKLILIVIAEEDVAVAGPGLRLQPGRGSRPGFRLHNLRRALLQLNPDNPVCSDRWLLQPEV